MFGLYYGLNVDYASLLWEEFGTSISHSILAIGVSSARFWGLIMKEIYNREDILIPSDVDTTEFPSMIVPKIAVDDATIFPVGSRIPDSMLKLMDPKNPLFVKYFLSIDSTQTVVLPLKVSQKGVEGPSKGSKFNKTKKQLEKSKEVEEDTKTSKGVLKRTKKSAKKSSDSENTKPTQEPILETVDPIAKTISMENHVLVQL